MKKLDTYINEKLVISKDINTYKYHPINKEELQEIIKERIEKNGPECDLNDIDTSAITDMEELFVDIKNFNGDISKWDVSNVKDMSYMFYDFKKFNCDISNWDVRNLKYAISMFNRCENFNCDISGWNVENLENALFMFKDCKHFDQDLSKWNLCSVLEMSSMFSGCENFDGSKLESWKSKLRNDQYVVSNRDMNMFNGCKSAPSWWKNK